MKINGIQVSFPKYDPEVYIFENMEFRNMFKGYRLLKIGYSQCPIIRLTQMPAADVCKIIYTAKGGQDSELLLKESFGNENNIILFPYYGYYNRVKVKWPPYYEVSKFFSVEMYDYLNSICYDMGKGWGHTEWFIVKFL
jgi:hypothetical protein